MQEIARRTFLVTVIVVAVVIAVLALWKLRVLIALLFLAFIIAAAMRPGIEALRRRGVPRGLGLTVAATLVNVIVLDKDPAEEDVPSVLFPAKDAEG